MKAYNKSKKRKNFRTRITILNYEQLLNKHQKVNKDVFIGVDNSGRCICGYITKPLGTPMIDIICEARRYSAEESWTNYLSNYILNGYRIEIDSYQTAGNWIQYPVKNVRFYNFTTEEKEIAKELINNNMFVTIIPTSKDKIFIKKKFKDDYHNKNVAGKWLTDISGEPKIFETTLLDLNNKDITKDIDIYILNNNKSKIVKILK